MILSAEGGLDVLKLPSPTAYAGVLAVITRHFRIFDRIYCSFLHELGTTEPQP